MTVHVLISGMVQGVGFRFFIRSNALKLGVNGWVKNINDGKVEALFQGEKENIDQMILLCKKGPMLSKIQNVEVEERETESYNSFEIIK